MNVTYSINTYKNEYQKLCKIESPNQPPPKIYTDAACTKEWDPACLKSYAFKSDKEYYNKPLFCKLNPNAKNNDTKNIYVMDITINY